MAQVIDSGKATLLELREKYSLEDMYNIWDVVYTQRHNKLQARERAIRESKMRKK